jgi:hypothetical protein
VPGALVQAASKAALAQASRVGIWFFVIGVSPVSRVSLRILDTPQRNLYRGLMPALLSSFHRKSAMGSNAMDAIFGGLGAVLFALAVGLVAACHALEGRQ